MVWSVFNYLLTRRLARKAKVALGCSQYKKLLKTLKVAQKLPSTIYLCLQKKFGGATPVHFFYRLVQPIYNICIILGQY